MRLQLLPSLVSMLVTAFLWPSAHVKTLLYHVPVLPSFFVAASRVRLADSVRGGNIVRSLYANACSLACSFLLAVLPTCLLSLSLKLTFTFIPGS